MRREEFESCMTMPDGVEYGAHCQEYLENGVSTDVSRGIQLAWEIWELQQDCIDELERKVKGWEQSFNQVTSAWSHDKIKQQAIIEALEASIKTAWWHTEQATNYRKKYGVHLAAALKGDKLVSEPEDQRLDKVRDMRDNLIFMLEQSYVIDHMQEKDRINALRKKYKVKP